MQTIQDFIAEKKHLVWYVKDPRALDNDAIVEAVLNYGNWDDVQKMIKILGIKTVARIFYKQTDPRKRRCNYAKETQNYFKIYFQKHAAPSIRFNASTKTQKFTQGFCPLCKREFL